MSKPPVGWGSFHSEREDEKVEILINRPESEYKAPQFPIDASLDKYPVCSSAEKLKDGQITFGAATKEALFYLEKDCCFLNHGAFGASLKPVVEIAHKWQARMESQPLRFIDRELLPLLVYATRRVAKFVGCPARDMVLTANATTGLNCIFKSVELGEGDRVLSLDVGYGATKKMLQYVTSANGGTLDELHLSFPVLSDAEVVNLVRRYFRQHKKDNTLHKVKLAVFDYINSNSALMLPVHELVDVCREFNVPVMIDGAHTLGSIALNIQDLNPTFFVANAHKWLCSAKGAAMLYVNPEWKGRVVPLNISHGFGGGSLASDFIWTGLMDYGPWLSLTSAIDYWEKVGVNNIRKYIHSLARDGANLLVQRWNSELLAAEHMFATMFCVRLPGPRVPLHGNEANLIQDALYFKYNIECPVKMLQNRLYVRVSAHIHNDLNDFIRLSDAMLEMRPRLDGEDEDNDREAAMNAATVCVTGGCG